ncbi:hypothetical protein [Bradyrhizobium sp. CCBAU 53421]|uniref:hypothetical protein n=1 Tax=Bradyrhizobium sp. CCBAU 53421 TaxID=1325120 RepID=UPI00188ADF35|nr:hypothetical protein [Bradyrhizobium sp. CCBAU 53421]
MANLSRGFFEIGEQGLEQLIAFVIDDASIRFQAMTYPCKLAWVSAEFGVWSDAIILA